MDNDTAGLTNIDPTLAGVPATLPPFYPALVGVRGDIFSERDSENFAVFTEWEKDFAKKWSVFGGVRYDYEQQDENTDSARTLLSPLPDPAAAPGGAAGPVGMGIAQVNGLLLS